ncbi:rhodopsin-like [Convolutriloba macropyga]|uniref:rhodopsin-like n=1 Tax=Convolutriloba macropyga TaxID=536237 RepID=UPI003F52374A
MSVNSCTCATAGDDSWRDIFYEPVPDYVHYICAAVLICLLILGIIGNGTAILLYFMVERLQTPQNMLLLNLAVVDTIMMMSCQPIFLYSSLVKGWQFGNAGCRISGTFATFGGLGSISSMTAIAYDRYIMISFAADAKSIASKSRSRKIITFVWLYASIFALIPNLGYGNFVLNGFQTSCTFDYMTQDLTTRTQLMFMYLMGFLSPLLISIFCYVNIFHVVMDAKKKKIGGGVNRHGNKKSKHDHKQNREYYIAKASVISICLFLVTWLPYAIVALIGQFHGPHLINPYVSTLPALFAKSNCVYNPYVYAIGHAQYRQEISRWLAKLRPGKQEKPVVPKILLNMEENDVTVDNSSFKRTASYEDNRSEQMSRSMINIEGAAATVC